MKTKLLFLANMLFLSIAAFATDISVGSATGEEVSGTWTKGSKVTLNGHIVVPEGKSLTIEEGVTVLINDSSLHIEFIVLGNLYCKGTEANPITFTASDTYKTAAESESFPRLWSGIICSETCSEVLMLYTNISYTGALTTNSSPSVALLLFKAVAGEGVPVLNFRNSTSGKLVIEHCTFHNLGEDGVYLEGGNYIIQNNLFYTQGETGGDAINLKAGSIADISYNVVFSPNTNALKLSNSGDRTPQCNPICYNNTIVNCGWRRPAVKGGGVWLEADVLAEIYNNLHVNCRFAVKNSKANASSKYDYNYYYGYDQTTVDQFQAGVKDVVRGDHDVAGTTAGSNDPLFVNYDLSFDKNSEVYNTASDFHLKAGSPAIGAGTTAFTRHFGTTGITIDGVEYKSAEPSTTIGAYGLLTVTSVTVAKHSLELNIGDTATISYTVLPAAIEDKSVTWSSSNAAVATVSNGIVTAVATGVANIVVTTTDGSLTDTCKVYVNTVAPTATVTISTENEIAIYPNPVADVLNVNLKAVSAAVNVAIYSVLGNQIIEKNYQANEVVSLSVANLKAGVYYAVVKSGSILVTKPFVKK